MGVGGGFLIVPLQILWTRTEPHRASGTSLAAILPIALVGACAYYFGGIPGQVDFAVALFLVVGSMVGAYLGASLIGRVPERTLKFVVAVVLLVVAFDELLGGLLPGVLLAGHHASAVQLAAWQYGLIVVAGLLIGTLSGLTGVGGGIFLVPTLVIGFGLSQHLAQGTSLVAILPTAAVGAITHLRRGNVDVRAAAWIGVAGIPTALVGAALALALPQAVLAVLFGLLLVYAAARIWPRRQTHPLPTGARSQTVEAKET
ncbi:MAG: sulfite exporter TauE/SafE family protein [Candidatus Dormibacteraceae bacterium]